MNTFEINSLMRRLYGRNKPNLFDEVICSKCGRRLYVDDALNDCWEIDKTIICSVCNKK